MYLKFQHTTKDIEYEIAKYFESSEHVVWVGSCYGDWELVVEFNIEDFSKLHSFLSEFYNNYSKYILKKELIRSIFEDFFGHRLKGIKNDSALHIKFQGEKIKLDDIDKEILEYVIKCPDYQLYKAALDLGISVDIVRHRIKKLIQNKIILGYSIQLDFSSLDRGWYIFRISADNYKSEKRLFDFLQRHNNVFYMYKFLGAWDYEIGLHIKSSEELEKFISDLKSQFPEMIKDYGFYLITKLYKMK